MSTTVFPSQNSWITPRTSETKIDSNNCMVILPQKISEIKQVLINAQNIKISIKTAQTQAVLTPLTDYYTAPNDSARLQYLDITKYVVEQAKHNALPLIKPVSEGNVVRELSINNAQYYVQNEKILYIVNQTIRTHPLDWFKNVTVWNMTIASAFDSLLRSSTLYTKPLGSFQEASGFVANVEKMDNNPMTAQFRVYYTPLGESVNLETVKTNPQENEFAIPFSQQQPIVNNTTLGREMQSLTNRTGCETKEVVRTFTDISQLRKPGAFWREKDSNGKPTGNIWRLTKVQLQIYCDRMFRAMETWSKNWTLQSPNVPINREFRSWNIPADIVQRNLHWNDYCLITAKENITLPNNALISDNAQRQLIYTLFDYNGVSLCRNECNIMWLYTKNNNTRKGAVLSSSAFGFGNSLVFSGKTQDNLSAGTQRVKSDDNDDNYQFCRDVYYCNEDGKLENMLVQIGGVISSNNTEAYYSYPEYSDDGSKKINGIPTDGVKLFKDDMQFRVLKDPSEQLNFTYQLHMLTDSPNLVIGPAWAGGNPLVKQVGENGTAVKKWYLTSLLPAGAKVMTPIYGALAPTTDTFIYTSAEDGTFEFAVKEGQTIGGKAIVGSCITDAENNIIVAYNGVDSQEFKLHFTHFYQDIYQAIKNK